MPVHTCVAECAWNVRYVIMPLWGILFRGCTSGEVYVPFSYKHARWELPDILKIKLEK